MAESILVTGKKISSMELVTNVTGNEKIPTGQPEDLAITPNQIADHTIDRGDLASQEDLSQVEVSLGTQITDLANDVISNDNSIRGLIAAEEAARIAADNLKVDKEGSVSSVAGRVGDVVLTPSDVLVGGFGSQEDVNKYVAKPFLSGYTYGLGERVVLDSGEVVKSLVQGNLSDPNVSMVGWVSTVSDSLSDTIQTFNTSEAGVDPVTGVAGGAYFNVRSTEDGTMLDEYQNIGGVPTPSGRSYPSAAYVQDIAKYTALPFIEGKTYGLNERVQLASGDIVKSIVAGNTTDPNADMAGWVLTNDATQIRFKPSALNSAMRNVFDKLEEMVSVKDFGAVGDGVTDDTVALNKAIASVVFNSLYIPTGTYVYSSLDNINTSYRTIRGAGSGESVLKCTKVGGVAFLADAFPTSAITPFITGTTFQGFSIVAPTAETIMQVQGFARSRFIDIRLNGTNGSAGTHGLKLKGVQLSYFENVYCSYSDGAVPETAVALQHGVRGGVTIGQPSNNMFINLYPEGSAYGVMMSAGDQNMFIGGAPEACTVRGLTVGIGCRYNTFISVGFENDLATFGDVSDAGAFNKYINCYSSKGFVIQGRSTEISGGIHEKITIDASATMTTITDITVDYWRKQGVVGGFINNGTGLRYRNIYNHTLATYIYPNKPRYAVTPTGTPFTWVNDTGVPVKFKIHGGTVTLVRQHRGSDNWEEWLPTDANKTGVYMVSAGDSILISYTVAPTVNVIPLNGM